MQRFFVLSEQVHDNKITIIGSDVNHIKNVLRMGIGDEIEAFDSSGSVYLAEIIEIGSEKIICKIVESRQSKVESRINITLAQCLPKSKKMDFIVQKATELGANGVIPVISERSIPKIEEKADKKLLHWQKIAKEAAEQSGRTKIPEIKSLTTFKKLINTAKDYDLALIPWEGEMAISLKNISLMSRVPDPQSLIPRSPNILVLIGSEGGFSKQEVESAIKEGFKSISLGKRILRTETAGIVILSQIFYELE